MCLLYGVLIWNKCFTYFCAKFLMIFQLHQKPDPVHTTQMNYTPKNGIGKLKRKVLSNLHFTHFFAKTYWSSLKLNFSNPVHHYLTFALPSAFSGSKRPIGD